MRFLKLSTDGANLVEFYFEKKKWKFEWFSLRMNDRNPWQSEPALIRATQPSRWYWQIRLHSDPLEGCSGCEPALINGHFHLANQYQQQRHLPRWLALPHRLSNQIQILAPKKCSSKPNWNSTLSSENWRQKTDETCEMEGGWGRKWQKKSEEQSAATALEGGRAFRQLMLRDAARGRGRRSIAHQTHLFDRQPKK